MTTAIDTTPVMESPADASAIVTLFHISLNVADLDKAVAFYQILLGVNPAKRYPDYAKFELADPPLVLSLEPQMHATGGALNHLGFRVAKSAALIEIQHRLESAGISTNREEGVECCYARQTKFWVHDPDRNLWEIYVLEGDTEHRGAGSPPESDARTGKSTPGNAPATPAAESVWEHQIGQPFPETIALPDGSIDRILLRGTFNTPVMPDERTRIFSVARRSLRAGGRVVIHGLLADSTLPIGASLKLPGPAAVVSHVPTYHELADALIAAKFHSIRLLKLSANPVFHHQGIALREFLLEGIKLDSTAFDLRQSVLYQGPLREVTDDFGNIYRRGQPTIITTPAIEALRAGPIVDCFVFLPPG